MFRYISYKEVLYSDEFGYYVTFGIRVIDSERGEICSVSDVSLDKEFVNRLCFDCTDGQLDPIHLMDVIEDNI